MDFSFLPLEVPITSGFIIETYYLEASFAFLGEDILENLAEVDLENINIDELEELTYSPFTEEEEKWLHEAINYNMRLED